MHPGQHGASGLFDLGQYLKPFAFLDLVDAPSSIAASDNLHPHSGIATVTVLPEGNLRFDMGKWGAGLLDYGGVESMRADGGIWHGGEYRPASEPHFRGFQLWVALPAALEASEPEGSSSRRRAPHGRPGTADRRQLRGQGEPGGALAGLTYLVVTLAPAQSWTCEIPAGPEGGWLSLSRGSLLGESGGEAGELIACGRSDEPIPLLAGPEGATFVLGDYSVHTSQVALKAGEARILSAPHLLRRR